MIKTITKIIFILFSFSVIAQTKNEISGKIIDKTSGTPLPGASVAIQYSLSGTIADNNGNFSISIPDSDCVLLFSMVGYETRELSIKQLKKQNFNVALKNNSIQLKEVIITDNKVQPIVESKLFYVFDYAFINGGVILLTFKHKLADAKLMLTDETGNLINYINVPETPEKLTKDCLGNVHLVTKNKTYQVYFDSARKSLQYLYPYPRKYFEAIMSPCVASLDGNLYFKECTFEQTVIYSFQSKQMKKSQFLTSIAWPRERVRMFKDEGRFQFMKKSQDASPPSLEEIATWPEKTVFAPLFAPLFKVNHNVYVFNYVDSIIESYDIKGSAIAKVKINYNDYRWNDGWKKEIFTDEKQNKAYTLYLNGKAGVVAELKEINLSNATLRSSGTIPFNSPQNIKVYNGYAYFICKGNNSWDDTKYLYRMKLD